MEVIEEVYDLRHKFVLVGLTGRTGSGSSSVASILTYERDSFVDQKLSKIDWEAIESEYPNANVVRKTRIVRDYISDNWHQFYIIKASNIIMYYALLLNDFESFRVAVLDYLSPIGKYSTGDKSGISTKLNDLKIEYEGLAQMAQHSEAMLKDVDEYSVEDLAATWRFISIEISHLKDELRSVLGCNYINVFQKWGNNIRKGNSIVFTENRAENSPSCLANKINRVVKLLRQLSKLKGEQTFIAIDSLRNPYEILYFRERYAAFYIMSVNTSTDTRYSNLKEHYSAEHIKAIDEVEKEKKNLEDKFMQIDIDKCIELSDIHISVEESIRKTQDDSGAYLSKAESKLISQLITYISLILHPGLVPPSSSERIMQIAYTAKLNSGCLSRQVGAVVTNESYSVKSIGWNTVPQGQTPCSMRCIDELLGGEDVTSYSVFERTDSKFLGNLKNLRDEMSGDKRSLRGLRLAYCFKDVYTSGEEKQTNNQVHTRSLHAEENAFLQLAKYGSIGIEGGILFTTASCCELCAKKAYQLGIKEIIYIDAYPGITASHILACGRDDYRPKMKLFSGAVGRAYINLFNPLVPMKDEIESRTGIKVKDTIKNSVTTKSN